MAGAGLLGIDALAIEPEWLATRTVRAQIKGLGKGLAGYRIGLISDVHFPRNISNEFVDRACSLLVSAGADIAVLPGDFVDGRFIRSVPSMEGLFDRLSEVPDGAFGVLGNHDHWLDADGTRREMARSTPIRLIENEHVLIERGGDAIAVGGIGDLWEGVVDINRTFQGLAPDVPRVLLSHNPDFAEENADPGRVDLQLSGHTHGGEIVFPWGYAPVHPSMYGSRFRYGFGEGKSHRCFTTAGICSPRHARLFCRPEVVIIELEQAT